MRAGLLRRARRQDRPVRIGVGARVWGRARVRVRVRVQGSVSLRGRL